FDAIIGARVARENQWDIDSEFTLVHGGADSEHVHDEKFRVVGVLKQTGTPNDKSVFVNLEGFYQIEGHDKPIDEARRRWGEFYGKDALPEFDKEIEPFVRELEQEQAAGGHSHAHHHHGTPDVLKEVTSVLVLTRSTEDAIMFSGRLKKGFQAQAVNPIIPMRQLMRVFVGNVQKILMVLTGLIIMVSGVGIFVSIYNSMADRRHEIAVMRALGARRQTVFSIILTESVVLCIAGGLLGLLLGHGLVFATAPYIESQTGLLIDRFSFEPIELYLFPALAILASLVGFIPGLTAYRTDVADAL
ncbi:MAG: ABC transporter permease, partial [Planctomycetaceae bacterium]